MGKTKDSHKETFMTNVTVDLSKTIGKIKPMHATNNGPKHKFAIDQRVSNLEAFKEAGIPYARNHDAAFCSVYGGEHTVDVNNIFTNFDADPYDPASYDFVLTDEYLQVIELSGAKVFYRLGSKIEHWRKKYNTLPPKDFKKWAIICEHIIKHYCYGWADGFHMDIEYWEIWNEPDLDADDSPNKRCWGGTAKQFYELFRIALEHLKTCFPELKIGGPAIAHVGNGSWLQGLLDSLGDIKPDFISWHVYGSTVEKIQRDIRRVREILDKNGLTECESHLNEWNYVRGWAGDDWIYSLHQMKNHKGAAFIAATMLMSQSEPLDMLMYYDARSPGGMNGMFDSDIVTIILKGYYPFYMFNTLYEQKNQVEATVSDADDVWACAAAGDGGAVMMTYYNDDDGAPAKKDVKVSFKNVRSEHGVRLEYYLHDKDNDLKLIREEIFTAEEFSAYITMPLHSTYLLKVVKI